MDAGTGWVALEDRANNLLSIVLGTAGAVEGTKQEGGTTDWKLDGYADVITSRVVGALAVECKNHEASLSQALLASHIYASLDIGADYLILFTKGKLQSGAREIARSWGSVVCPIRCVNIKKVECCLDARTGQLPKAFPRFQLLVIESMEEKSNLDVMQELSVRLKPWDQCGFMEFCPLEMTGS